MEDAQLADVQLRDLGDHYLKDIELPQRLFQVEADGLPSQFPRLGARNTAGTVGTLVAIDLSGWRHVLRKLGDDGAATAAAAFHKIVTDATRAADGVAVELVGDWSLCLFPVPKSALVATTAIKRELETSGWIEGVEKPLLKAAVHTGRVTGRRGQPLGSAALRVSLMCGGAQPGQILVSHSTHAVLEGEVLPDFTLTDLGEREYGDTGPTRTYELTLVDSPS